MYLDFYPLNKCLMNAFKSKIIGTNSDDNQYNCHFHFGHYRPM